MQAECIKSTDHVHFMSRPYQQESVGSTIFNKKTLLAACMMSSSIIASPPLNTSAQGTHFLYSGTNNQGSYIIRTSIQSYNGSKSHEQVVSSPKIKEAVLDMREPYDNETKVKISDYRINIQPEFDLSEELSFDEEVKLDFSRTSKVKESYYRIEPEELFDL